MEEQVELPAVLTHYYRSALSTDERTAALEARHLRPDSVA
jgi:hypothetical protein